MGHIAQFRYWTAKKPLQEADSLFDRLPLGRKLYPGRSFSRAVDAEMPVVMAKFMRFGLVGVFSAGIYSIVVVGVVVSFKLDGKLANLIGYAAALPINFMGHRRFTFLSNGIAHKEAIRFCTVHAANIVVSTGGFGVLVDGMRLPYWLGIVSTLILVPITTFIIMDLWVFREWSSPIFRE